MLQSKSKDLRSRIGYDRVFVKDRLSLNEMSVFSTRCLNWSNKTDMLSKKTSQFTLEVIPTAAKEGDVLILIDTYGTTKYTGVINRIEEKTIECEQIYSLFNDTFLWEFVFDTSIEKTVSNWIEQKLKINDDPMIEDLFSVFSVSTESYTLTKLPSQDTNYTFNGESFIYELFEKYDILVDVIIPFGQDIPKIIFRKNDKPKIKLIDNTVYTLAFNPVTEVYENNKLIVYSSDGAILRGTFYGSRNGITDNPNEITRLTTNKTKIAFSDDEISIIKAQNLRNQMYNHKIDCTLLMNNPLYDFDDMYIGQEFDVYVKGVFYNTILTGYEMEKETGKGLTRVKLIFGKVRLKLSERLNQL